MISCCDHQRLCLTMAASFLTPIYTSSGKRQLISDHIKGPLVAVFRLPLMKALDRSVETLGLCIATSSVTFNNNNNFYFNTMVIKALPLMGSFIKSVNQSSIKLCLQEQFLCLISQRSAGEPLLVCKKLGRERRPVVSQK